jgi:CheY-like chemotaxis protein
MDIGLPDMDGLALTQILKADQKTCHIIIVALTAFAMKGDEEKAIAAGCDGYIIKPIDTRKFPRLVAELLLRGIVSGQSKPAPIVETKA